MKNKHISRHLKDVLSQVEVIHELSKKKRSCNKDVKEHIEELHDYIKTVLKDV